MKKKTVKITLIHDKYNTAVNTATKRINLNPALHFTPTNIRLLIIPSFYAWFVNKISISQSDGNNLSTTPNHKVNNWNKTLNLHIQCLQISTSNIIYKVIKN